MVIYKIWSRGIDYRTNKPFYRTEYVDTKKNALFGLGDSPNMVAKQYEVFWNLDKREKVKVEKVKKVNIKSRGQNWGIKISKKRLSKII